AIEERVNNLLAEREREIDPNRRASFAAAIGGCYEFLGEPKLALQYLRLALQEDPNHPEKAEILSHIALFEDPSRKTPWDVEGAVLPYDDFADIEKHKDLPYEDFLRLTVRGSIRKTILDAILKLYRPGMRVLEAGCAMAGYYGMLRPFVDIPDYCGIDLTPMMIQKAGAFYPNATFARMDVRRLGFQTDAFDLVFSTDVTMHIVEWKQAISELYRVTKNYLILRLRLAIDNNYPTLVAHLGAGKFEIPYVIHNWPELARELGMLEPPLEEAIVLADNAETMYGHLWQIYREHPDLPTVEKNGQIGINRRFDVLLVKRKILEKVRG
ncbi:MAG TPA: class I SAM-dependent methyltransferase, partial [bacterium]|nr:class I SAM-dependent methyltransferase [bacterium]